MTSPRKKKSKTCDESFACKRVNETAEINAEERVSLDENELQPSKYDSLQALKRINFVTACKKVSYNAYFNYNVRFQLGYLPSCVKSFKSCKHQDDKNKITLKQMPPYAEESFNIELKSNMWCEALEVCYMSITKDQYLSPNCLRNILEIILNAHEDEYADFTVDSVINKCQEVLSQNFSIHPPCNVKSLRQCYKDFLISPMDQKLNTFTNREQFGHNEGIVKYCMNRLEYEISMDSKDDALINKYENIPEEMKDSVKGLHWQKEKMEIYELLDRQNRIKRLMAVLETLIELLQFDLAMWHSRFTNNLGLHVMRSHKPLMAFILWQNNILYTGTVSNNCRQILKLFAYLIHLKYSEDYLKIMTNWFNTIVQTFYVCETNSNCDYPNPGKYSAAFAREFYKIIAALPNSSLISILERIKPTYMQYLVGALHFKTLLCSNEDDVINNFISFVTKMEWKYFPESSEKLIIKKQAYPVKHKNLLSYLIKLLQKTSLELSTNAPRSDILPKMDTFSSDVTDLNHIIHILYITLQAFLNAYNVQNVQETLDILNEHILQSNISNLNTCTKFCSYTVTEHFVKQYRSIYQKLKVLVSIIVEKKNQGTLHEIFEVFENIELLGLKL